MTVDLERPLRHPDTDSGPLMTKRARWLVVIGFLLPGSAQLLAGNRRLGRFGLVATCIMLGVLLLSLAGLLFARPFTLSIFTNSLVLLVVQWLIAAYGVLWLVLGFNTLRLTRLVRVLPGWRVPVAMLSVVLTALSVAGAAWASTTVGAGRGAISSIFGGNAPAVEPVDGRYNILLLGADMEDGRDSMRPDSISLVSVDAETGRSLIVGLPREMQGMPIPESSPLHQYHPNGFGVDGCNTDEWGDFCYLNHIYNDVELFQTDLYPDAVSRGSEPGIEGTKDAVSGATGLEVQFFVLIDMDGFEELIDALGGVDMDVTERLPIGGNEEGVGIEGWLEPGEQRLNGWEALWYARSRYGSTNGDYDRMERQRELQAAILAQMNPRNVLTRFQQVAEAGGNIVETDIPESMLGTFVDLAADAREFSPVTVELTPPEVDPEYPDWGYVRELVQAGVADSSPPEETEEAEE